MAAEIRVIGYADPVGAEASNRALSLARAEHVAAELRARGVPPDRLRAIGGGVRVAPLSPSCEGRAAGAGCGAWSTEGAPSARSDCWTQKTEDDEALHLEATALRVGPSRLLVITRNDALVHERRRVLQRARELRLVHDALSREVERKEVLVHCIVHDLSGPLNSLLGALSLLQEQPLPDAGAAAPGEERGARRDRAEGRPAAARADPRDPRRLRGRGGRARRLRRRPRRVGGPARHRRAGRPRAAERRRQPLDSADVPSAAVRGERRRG
ncbi:OmpA family protein [Sorangium sp. So ce1128]